MFITSSMLQVGGGVDICLTMINLQEHIGPFKWIC